MTPLTVCALFLAVGCACRPQDADSPRLRNDDDDGAVTPPSPPSPSPTTTTTTTGRRASRLQKPTQALNPAFDEIVVESNLQVHNRAAAASKNKSKIVLPSNSTASPTGSKSARSLLV